MKNWKQNQIKRINSVDFIPRKNIDVVKKLLSIFHNHIGEENAITATQLFKKVYKSDTKSVTDLQLYLLGNQLTVALAFMRQHTNCFVVREKSNLWVAKTVEDFEIFNRYAKARIKGLENLIDRCDNAVKEQWWRRDFAITKQIKAQATHHDVGYLEGMSI